VNDALCPCGGSAELGSADRSYAACCGRFHRSSKLEPPSPEALMRSRFSAFAKADIDWLHRTLHPEHEDRRRPKSAFRKDLTRHFATGVRYVRLEVLDAPKVASWETGLVLFVAHGVVKKADFLLAELSTFQPDGQGWRYLSGQTIPETALGPDAPGGRVRLADLRRRGIVV
jgi:SEC-C motif domain protein